MEHYNNLDLNDIVYLCEFDKTIKIEKWKDIVGYEKIYQISDLGRVKSLSRTIYNHGTNPFNSKEKILKGALLKNGYISVALRLNNKQKTFYIHILVAMAFLKHIPCGFVLVVNHKNFVKTDNKKINLEIVTNRENSNKKHLKSTSKYVGVSWNKCNNKWQCYIRHKGKAVFLGHFINEEEAGKAYQNKLNEINSIRI
jgi:hypothetical protein